MNKVMEMKTRLLLLVVAVVALVTVAGAQQSRRLDTTMKVGKAGYKVTCSNKNADQNSVTIGPVGFEREARDVTVQVKGRITRAEVDDLNNDGFPDLVMYVSTPGELERATVFGISSDKNNGFLPIYFPDVYDDQKLRTGYHGHDSYLLMEGSLIRRFPIYTTDTANIKPTGMIRQVQYRVLPGERGELKFKVIRTYDYAKQ